MDAIFEDFIVAYEKYQGYKLSATFSPIPPPSEPDRLYSFYRSTNFANAKQDFKYRILFDKSNPIRVDAEEGNGWVEVFYAYWVAVGEIWKAEEAVKANTKV